MSTKDAREVSGPFSTATFRDFPPKSDPAVGKPAITEPANTGIIHRAMKQVASCRNAGCMGFARTLGGVGKDRYAYYCPVCRDSWAQLRPSAVGPSGDKQVRETLKKVPEHYPLQLPRGETVHVETQLPNQPVQETQAHVIQRQAQKIWAGELARAQQSLRVEGGGLAPVGDAPQGVNQRQQCVEGAATGEVGLVTAALQPRATTTPIITPIPTPIAPAAALVGTSAAATAGAGSATVSQRAEEMEAGEASLKRVRAVDEDSPEASPERPLRQRSPPPKPPSEVAHLEPRDEQPAKRAGRVDSIDRGEQGRRQGRRRCRRYATSQGLDFFGR